MVFFNNEQRIVDPKLILPFCRTFRHIVGSSPGKCSRGFSVRQSAMGNEVLSKGSAHLGSPSDLHTQHLIDSPIKIKNEKSKCFHCAVVKSYVPVCMPKM